MLKITSPSACRIFSLYHYPIVILVAYHMFNSDMIIPVYDHCLLLSFDLSSVYDYLL